MKTSKLLTYWPYLLAFLILTAWSLWQFPWHLSSSDAVFYLMNAEEGSQFQLSDSISSYWSPLWSWMMVPFFWMGLADLWPMKVLQILIGAYGLILGLHILDRLELRPTLHLTGGILFLLACWMMHLSHTPDLLMAVLLLQFFYWTWTDQTTVLRSGLIGGALFLCKSFGFPFFVAYLIIHTIWEYWNKKQRSILFQGLKTIGFFAVIAGAWIGLMTLKFGWVGLGTSGSYNMAYMGPIMNFQPPYFDQFVNPETTYTKHFIAEEARFIC